MQAPVSTPSFPEELHGPIYAPSSSGSSDAHVHLSRRLQVVLTDRGSHAVIVSKTPHCISGDPWRSMELSVHSTSSHHLRGRNPMAMSSLAGLHSILNLLALVSASQRVPSNLRDQLQRPTASCTGHNSAMERKRRDQLLTRAHPYPPPKRSKKGSPLTSIIQPYKILPSLPPGRRKSDSGLISNYLRVASEQDIRQKGVPISTREK